MGESQNHSTDSWSSIFMQNITCTPCDPRALPSVPSVCKVIKTMTNSHRAWADSFRSKANFEVSITLAHVQLWWISISQLRSMPPLHSFIHSSVHLSVYPSFHLSYIISIIYLYYFILFSPYFIPMGNLLKDFNVGENLHFCSQHLFPYKSTLVV